MLASFRNSIERFKNMTQGVRRHTIAAVSDDNSRRVRITDDEIQRDRYLRLWFGKVNSVPHHILMQLRKSAGSPWSQQSSACEMTTDFPSSSTSKRASSATLSTMNRRFTDVSVL